MVNLASQIRDRLVDREITQTGLAARVHRSPARISELLRSLDQGMRKQDRLSLLHDIAEALQMELVLAPREKADEVMRALGVNRSATMSLDPALPSVFEELFVDLGADTDTDPDTENR